MTARAHRPPPRLLQRRPRPLPEADSPETRAEADRVAEVCDWIDEPEMIGRAILDAYGRDADYYRSLRHLSWVHAMRAIRRELTVEDRLRDAMARAKRQHVDASHELHVLAAMLERARRGGRHAPPSMLARLERLEAHLDHAVGL